MTEARMAREERAALAVGAVGLVVAALLQAPGRILPETKLDLVVNPGQYLSRVFHLWDPAMDFGRLQNQVVGYLFPMGPFYWLGHALGVPGWITQRLWIGGLLAIGFLGAALLARALDLGTPTSRWLGAAAYVLGPASLTLAATRSGTQTPMYLLPWILLPLVRVQPDQSPRRAAAWSGLAILAMGAVNGAATLLVLAAPILWLATRPAGPFRRRLAGWWGGAAVLATAWWIGPLALQGQYGYDFLAYTERASLTTSAASAAESLRGTGNWLAYTASGGHLWQPAGWELISNRLAIVATVLVAAAGLYGLAHHRLRERTFLILTFLTGMLVLGSGYGGSLGGPASGLVQKLLDGPLVAFRNVNKVQPLVALPLALGLSHALALIRVPSRSARPEIGRAVPALVTGLLVAVIACGALPLVQGRLPADGSFTRIPAYWTQAGHWLDTHAHGDRSLIVPGAGFGEYRWGRPLDEPLVSLTSQPLAARLLIPLGSNRATRLLDSIESQLSRGQIDPGTAATLARSGVGYLVVRNDLDLERTGAPAPGQVRLTMEHAVGFTRVASFGPRVDPGASAEVLAPRLGRFPGSPANPDIASVEIYRVGPVATRAALYPAAGIVSVTGESEAVIPAVDGGLTARQGTILLGDAVPLGVSPTSATITDVTRRRDVEFGDVRNGASYTLTTTGQAAGHHGPPNDRLDHNVHRLQAVAEVHGAATIQASSYGRDTFFHVPANQPFAAFDQDPTTVWQPSLGLYRQQTDALGAWIELDLDRARSIASIVLSAPTSPTRAAISAVEVRTDRGVVRSPVIGARDTSIQLPAGSTRTLRITITGIRTGAPDLSGPAITDISFPGLTISRPIATAAARPVSALAARATTVVLQRDRVNPFARDASDEDPRLDRVVSLTQPGTFTISGTATIAPGAQATLADPTGDDQASVRPAAAIVVSSTWGHQAALSASSAIDGKPATSWVAAPDDADPTITFNWDQPHRLDQIRLTPAGAPARTATTVLLTTPSGDQRRVAANGTVVHFAALTTSQLTISVAGTGPAHLAPGTGAALGLADVSFPRQSGLLPPGIDRAASLSAHCGDGPIVVIDGNALPTRITGTVGQFVDGAEVPFTVCSDPIALASGRHRVREAALDGTGRPSAYRTDNLLLAPTQPTPALPRRTLALHTWQPEHRTVTVGAGPTAVLALTENANPGWAAKLDGRPLTPLKIDGWRQAWVVPAGRGGQVTITFGPQRTFTMLLLLGLLLVMGLVAAAAVPARTHDPEITAMVESLRPVTEPKAPRLRVPWRELAIGLLVLVGLLIGGPVVLAVIPLWVVRRHHAWLLPWIAAGAAVLAGLVTWLHPGGLAIQHVGAFSGWAQAFAVTAVLAVATSLVPTDPEPPRPHQD